MKTMIEMMRDRRSVRIYNQEPITKEELDVILEAGLIALTGRNSKSTRFIVIQNKEALVELSKQRQSASKMLENASAAIIVCSDAEVTDLWIEDASIAAAYMHLCADSLGVGGCWVQVRERLACEKYLHQHLNLPDNVKPICILSLGHYDIHPSSHELKEEERSRVHFERW